MVDLIVKGRLIKIGATFFAKKVQSVEYVTSLGSLVLITTNGPNERRDCISLLPTPTELDH